MKGVFFVILACLLWSLDTLIRYPLVNSGVSSPSIVLIEHAILCLFFLPVLVKSRQKIWNARVSHLAYFVIVGGIGSALSTLCFTRAFAFLNPSMVILLQKMQPLVAVTLAALVLKESISKSFLLWGSLCLIGGVLVSHAEARQVWDGLSSGRMLEHEGVFMGMGLALFAVFGWGATTVFGKKLSLAGYNEKEIMAGRFTAGLLALAPMIFSGSISLSVSAPTLGKIVLMALLSGLLAMYVYYKGLRLISARLCSLTEMFFPFTAVVVNWIFLDAALDSIQIIGAGLLLAGSTVIQLKHY